jgi:hypothetical protein
VKSSELRLLMEQVDHGGSVYPDDAGGLDRAGGGHAEGLARQATLAEETPSLQNADDRLLSSSGDDRELDLATLYVEDGVGRVPLGEDALLVPILARRLALLDPGEEGLRVERKSYVVPHDVPLRALESKTSQTRSGPRLIVDRSPRNARVGFASKVRAHQMDQKQPDGTRAPEAAGGDPCGPSHAGLGCGSPDPCSTSS